MLKYDMLNKRYAQEECDSKVYFLSVHNKRIFFIFRDILLLIV